MKIESYQALYEVEKAHWWFSARRKILDVLVKEVVSGYEDTLRILDVGCSIGVTTGLLKRHGWTCGVDYYDEPLRFCRFQDSAILTQADACCLPFKAGSCDMLVALDLLEHMQDDKVALIEFNRVIKRGGFLVISVPAFKMLWGRLDDVAHHLRRYRLKELREKIMEEGFEIKKISHINCFLFLLIAVSRLMERWIKAGSQAQSDLKMPSKFVNNVLENIFSLEASLIKIKSINFPFGSSIICVAQKRSVRA